MTVLDRFLSRVRECPDRPAVEFDGTAVSYAQLDAWSAAVARSALAGRIERGTLIAINVPKSPAFFAAVLAIVRHGCPYLAVDPECPAGRLSEVLSDAGASLLLSTKDGQSLPCPTVAVPPMNTVPASPATDAVRVGRHAFAYAIYTSGSSGHAKGVLVDHGSLDNLVGWHVRAHQLAPSDRVAQIASLGFDAAVWDTWGTLCAGASLVPVADPARLGPRGLVTWLVRHRITVAFVPTALAEPLFAEAWPDGTPLRLLLTGGDRLTAFPAENLPFQVVNAYGPAEATVVATSGTVLPSGRTDAVWPSIGRPIDGAEIHLLDDAGDPVRPGEVGEICVSGRGLARGYLGRLAHTAIARHHGGLLVYRTGDTGRWRPDGQLDYVGRRDRQVQLRGFRIELGEIESRIAAMPGIDRTVVVPTLNEGRCTGLLAFVVPGKGVEVAPELIRERLREALPHHMIPSHIYIRASLPATINGKVDVAALASEVEPDRAVPATDRDDLIGRLVAIISAVLAADGIPATDVGPDANFFVAGGHSMLVPVLADRIEELFGVFLPIEEIFSAPTIADLATLIHTASVPAGGGRWTS